MGKIYKAFDPRKFYITLRNQFTCWLGGHEWVIFLDANTMLCESCHTPKEAPSLQYTKLTFENGWMGIEYANVGE